MDKIEALGATVIIPRGAGNIGPLLTAARLNEIELEHPSHAVRRHSLA